MTTSNKYAEAISVIAEETGLSQRQVAIMIGIDESVMSRRLGPKHSSTWEALLSVRFLLAIAKQDKKTLRLLSRIFGEGDEPWQQIIQIVLAKRAGRVLLPTLPSEKAATKQSRPRTPKAKTASAPPAKQSSRSRKAKAPSASGAKSAAVPRKKAPAKRRAEKR